MTWIDYIRGPIPWQTAILLIKSQKKFQGKLIGIPMYNLMYLSTPSKIWYRTQKEEMENLADYIIDKTKEEKYRQDLRR